MGNGQSQKEEEKHVAEIAAKETLIECPVLIDFNHGTIRHRHEEASLAFRNNETENKKVKLGYFYHPRLKDFSEDASFTGSESNRLKYVFKGPAKDEGKMLYYIYGTKTSDKDGGLLNTGYKPKGIGFDWPETYRHANHSYYDATFMSEGAESLFPQNDLHIDDEDADSEEDFEIVDFQKDIILMQIPSTEIIGGIIERISLQRLVPSSTIHIILANRELKSTERVIDFVRWAEQPPLYVQLRLVLT